MPSYELIVYGCQMNDYDGEVLAALLEAAGYEPAGAGETPDATIVYTCAVRRSATDRALGRITSLAARKRANPDAVIAVGGCWPAVEAAVIAEACPHVDFTFGPGELAAVPAGLAAARGVAAPSPSGALEPKRARWPRANVAVMKGCDNFCSYCIVPYARGRETYRPPAEVLREVEGLAAAGFKDITLVGQNVNSYRHGGMSFAALLAAADAVCDGVFLRFTTNHPRDLGADVAAAMAEGRNVARHLHLPLQSGSDRILHAMNRGYDMARYTAVVDAAREAIPGICLTTDLLVGFPGEGEDDFLATRAAVETIGFDGAYTFIYNPRPGTAAAALADTLPREEKVRRLEDVAGLQRRISREINERLVGKVVTALVEGRGSRRGGGCAARLSENKVVNFEGEGAHVGTFADLRITRASPWTLGGEPAAAARLLP